MKTKIGDENQDWVEIGDLKNFRSSLEVLGFVWPFIAVGRR
jgi:hypothetical protein